MIFALVTAGLLTAAMAVPAFAADGAASVGNVSETATGLTEKADLGNAGSDGRSSGH
jgi:hypothetical protein